MTVAQSGGPPPTVSGEQGGDDNPSPKPEHLARTARQQRLVDVYGALLTEHQREACRLHLDEDWSFTELAEHLACSRSGAHDLVRRALAQLEHVEARLGLAAELERRDELEADLLRRLARLRPQPAPPGPAAASPVPVSPGPAPRSGPSTPEV